MASYLCFHYIAITQIFSTKPFEFSPIGAGEQNYHLNLPD